MSKPNLAAFPFLLRRENGPVAHDVLTGIFASSKKITGVSSSTEGINVHLDNDAQPSDFNDVLGHIVREFTPFTVNMSTAKASTALPPPPAPTAPDVVKPSSNPEDKVLTTASPDVKPSPNPEVKVLTAATPDAVYSPNLKVKVLTKTRSEENPEVAVAASDDFCSFIIANKSHRVALPGKQLLDIACVNGSTMLYGLKDTWLLDEHANLTLLGTSVYNRQGVCNGYILRDRRVEQAPHIGTVVSLCKLEDWRPPINFLTGVLHEGGSVASIVRMDANMKIPKCTLTLDCIFTVNCKGYLIALSPVASKMFVYLGSELLYATPYECTPAASIALIGNSDFVLIAVPDKSFNLVNWKTGHVVKSGNTYPSLVVPVQDSIYIVNDTWTFATVIPRSAFNFLSAPSPKLDDN
jgi:hypothetical protein